MQLINSNISFDEQNYIDKTSQSEKKEQKKIDQELEQLFDQQVVERVNREKKSDGMIREQLQKQLVKSFDDYNEQISSKQTTVVVDAKQTKDLNDLRTDSYQQQVIAGQINQESAKLSEFSKDTGVDSVQRLAAVIQRMAAEGLSESSLQLQILTQGSASIDVALIKSRSSTGQKSHFDVLITSKSDKALDIISNQLTQLQAHLDKNQTHSINLKVIST